MSVMWYICLLFAAPLVHMLEKHDSSAKWTEDDIIYVNDTKSIPRTIHTHMHQVSQDVRLFIYVANIFVKNKHECTGAYIAPLWILTSAMCISDYTYQDCTIYMGSSRLDGKGAQSRKAEYLIAHKFYSQYPPRCDVGLIKLDAAFLVNEKVGMILVEEAKNVAVRKCNLVGWGLLSHPGEPLEDSSQIEILKINEINNVDCNRIYHQRNVPVILDNSTVCVTSTKDICMADIGTTMVCDGTLAGITPVTVECEQMVPVIVFKLTAFIDWIDKKVTAYNKITIKNGTGAKIRLFKENLVLLKLFIIFIKVSILYKIVWCTF